LRPWNGRVEKRVYLYALSMIVASYNILHVLCV
jgi:hypothetical protein